MFRVMIGIGAVLAGLAGPLMGQLDVDTEKKPAGLEEAKSEYAKWDKALNALYGELKKELDEWKFDLLKEDQKGWVEYKEYVSEGQAHANLENPQATVEYWEMAAGMTEERLDYLKGWRGIGEHGDWTGKYRDGAGGHLSIVETEEGIYFVIEVVRGHSFHLGVMGGLAKVNESLARFSIPLELDDAECWINFEMNRDGSGRVFVTTANSHEFHGARAYFDAAYMKVALLDEAARKKVIKNAKAGGISE